MAWLWWFGGALCVLLIAAAGVAAFGARVWACTTRRLVRRLEASRTEGAPPPAPQHYNARELDGLPAPVQRYFRAALRDGQPLVTAATLELSGSFNLSATGEQWKPFTSRQRVITRRPGFLWDARIAMLPGVPVRVVDSYIAGQGLLHAALLAS
jgi:hypothetical protein